MEIATLILALVGALAWTPFLYDKFKKPKIKGRLIGLTFSQNFSFSTQNYFSGSIEKLSGIVYFPKFVFVSLVKDFNISNTEVAVKYPGESEWRKGNLFFAPSLSLSMEGESNKKTLKIPSEEHINSFMTFERNRPVSLFIPFCVSRSTYEHFESMRITFTEYNGTQTSVCINREDVDAKKLMFEEKYWS